MSSTPPRQPVAGPSFPSPRPSPQPADSGVSDMTIKSALSRISGKAGTSKSASSTAPTLTTATVERSSYIGETEVDGLGYGGESPAEEMKTGETLTSLELDLEGDYETKSTTSEGEPEPSYHHPLRTPAPRSKRKRNRLRQLVSTEPSAQYLYDVDVAVNTLDPRTTLFEPPHKPPPLDVALAIEQEELLVDEGSSPKTILPGNALQLHLDDERVSYTPPTSFSSSSSAPERFANQKISNASDDQLVVQTESLSLNDESLITIPTKPPARVHFRSRVRITSGFHSSRHHRHREGSIPAAGCRYANSRRSVDDLTATTTSGSPSSSISAPLRYQPDENNLLGPLGKRLSSLAQSRKRRLGVYAQQNRGAYSGDVSERTPILGEIGQSGASVPNYSRQRRRRQYGGSGGEEDEDLVSGLKREEDIIFGKWPWRIFNRHWWWYQCEPILCSCGDDLDDE